MSNDTTSGRTRQHLQSFA